MYVCTHACIYLYTRIYLHLHTFAYIYCFIIHNGTVNIVILIVKNFRKEYTDLWKTTNVKLHECGTRHMCITITAVVSWILNQLTKSSPGRNVLFPQCTRYGYRSYYNEKLWCVFYFVKKTETATAFTWSVSNISRPDYPNFMGDDNHPVSQKSIYLNDSNDWIFQALIFIFH